MRHRLYAMVSVPIQLIWHENRRTYLSVKKQWGVFHLRVHRLFYDAPTPVLEALIQYAIKRDTKAGVLIKQAAHLYFSNHFIPSKSLKEQGNCYDLRKIFEKMLFLISQPLKNVTIGWSNLYRSKGRFKSITLGLFDRTGLQIRINPILDDWDVPLYFLEFVVYHEMLHASYPATLDCSGRYSIHSKEFREKERQFPFFKQAKDWEKKSLDFFKKRGRTSGRP